MFSTKFYISTKGEEGVKNFKYKGGSDSILYANFWSPLCNYIVENYVPSWMAPNLITTIGFIIHVIVHLLVMYYSPNLQNELPSWLFFLMAFSLFSYQILDNLDGKQARATGSSSALGMLFDHGCDAVATWMVTLNTIAVLQISSVRLTYYGVLFIGLIPFYFAMWSQYHVGAFRLGYINAVDEGLVVAQLMYFITGILGQQIWQNRVGLLYNLTYGEIMLLSTFILSILQMLQFTYDLYAGATFEKFISALKLQSCTIILILSFICVDIFIGLQNISQYFILFIYSLSLSWSKIITHIQVAHITEDRFDQWRYSFLFITISYIVSAIYFYISNNYIIQFNTLIFINLFIAFVCYAHFIYCVFNHMAQLIGIYIFRIGKRSIIDQFESDKGFIPLSNHASANDLIK